MRLAIVLTALSVILLAAPAAVGATRPDAGGGAEGSVGAGASSPSPCTDGKYKFLGPSAAWHSPLRWSFRQSSVPAGLDPAAVLAIIKQSFDNIVNARNDCSLPDRVEATHEYLGAINRRPGISSSGGCTGADGYNVVGFGRLGSYYSGYTCIYWQGNRITEADIRLDTDTAWALSLGGCNSQLLMEGLVTHEVGHAFGLAHVGENRHGRLTMSVYIDRYCDNQESTLGLGDIRGLEALY